MSTSGTLTIGATPAKSRAVSNGRLANVAGKIVTAVECTGIVVPSGSAFATDAAPMVPPAPVRFSHEGLAELRGELIGDGARHDVDGAAGRDRYDHAHRLAR